jgi:hypothetical protein
VLALKPGHAASDGLRHDTPKGKSLGLMAAQPRGAIPDAAGKREAQ